MSELSVDGAHDLTVTVLACEAGRSSGYLLDHDGRRLLIDCGPTVLAALHPDGPHGLDGVIITHSHADHCADLIGLAFAAQFPVPARARIPLWLPAEAIDTVRGMDDLFGVPTLAALRRPIEQSFHIRPLDLDGTSTVEPLPGLHLTAYEAKHAVRSAALRFEAGCSSMAFSSDTALTESLETAAHDVDLFVCEATYLSATSAQLEQHGHLTAAQAGHLAAAGEVRSLLLTHLSRVEDADQARADAGKAYDGPIQVACRGLVLSPTR